jgi:lysophospholipase L1-like esterase
MNQRPFWISAIAALWAIGCQPAGAPVVPTSLGAPTVAATPQPQSGPTRTPVQTPPTTPASRTWIALGDSITQDAFAADVAWGSVLGTGAPAFVNAGVRGDTTADALERLDAVLAAYPEATVVGVAFGTNDVYGRVTVEAFKTNVGAIVARVKASGRTPVLSTIPYSPDTEMTNTPAYNGAILEVTSEQGLPAGPDLYALVQAHEDYLRPDGIHMTAEGSQAIQRAWAAIAGALYR